MQSKTLGARVAIGFAFAAFAASTLTHAQGMHGSIDPIEMLEQADTNHDGIITRDEYLAARAARFDQLDRNHDGFLTEADFPQLGKKGGEHADKLREMLQKADVDHDGTVSREEFKNAGLTIFNLVDANHDGVIDKVELQHAAERLQVQRKN